MTEHARRNWSDSYADGGSIPPASTIPRNEGWCHAVVPTSKRVGTKAGYVQHKRETALSSSEEQSRLRLESCNERYFPVTAVLKAGLCVKNRCTSSWASVTFHIRSGLQPMILATSFRTSSIDATC
jgi:hypothetical protein